MNNSLNITSISVGALTRDKKNLVEVKSSTSIYNALRIMDQYNVISVPLYEAPQSDSPVGLIAEGREFVAYVSVSDILAYVLREATTENVQDVLDTRVLDVVGSTKETLIHSVESESEPLHILMRKMTRGLHRCLVFSHDHHRKAPTVLSQTDIVKFLVNNCTPSFPELEGAMGVSVQEVMTDGHLLSANEDAPLNYSVEMLQLHPAIAVVNSIGQVVSTLSSSDFRSIYRELEEAGEHKGALLKSLSDMTVKQYLTRNCTGDAYPAPAVCVSKDASLFAAAEYMVNHHIHRVWIVNDGNTEGELEGVGVGCLSFTDIIKSVMESLLPENDATPV